MFGAILGAVGALGSALIAKKARDKANKINVELARENREFQQVMSDTAIQRRVEDLKKAGLNPILAVSGIGAASTPPGNVATVQPVITDVASHLATAKLLKELKLTDEFIQTENTKQQLNSAAAMRTLAETRNIEAVNPAVKASARLTALERDFMRRILESPLGSQLYKMNYIVKSLLPFGNLVGSAKSANVKIERRK